MAVCPLVLIVFPLPRPRAPLLCAAWGKDVVAAGRFPHCLVVVCRRRGLSRVGGYHNILIKQQNNQHLSRPPYQFVGADCGHYFMAVY